MALAAIGSPVRLWKSELQKLTDELDIAIEVHHLALGTSEWNKIGHRLYLVHPPELARQALGQLSIHRRSDRRDDHTKPA